MRNSKVLLFDLDGTLIDSKTTIAHHFIKALDDLNINHIITAKDIEDNLEIPFEDLISLFNVNMTALQFKEFIQKYRDNYHNSPLNGTKVFEGTYETLSLLKKLNYNIVIATGKHIENAVDILEKLQLTKYFDFIQGWEDGLKPKPEPDILVKAIEKIGKSSKDCIMIGDTHVDILAGQSINIPTIAVLYGFGRYETLLKHMPDYTVNNIKELPIILDKIK